MARPPAELPPHRHPLLNASMYAPADLLERDAWQVERRGDGALLVRVSSRPMDGSRLPDAVFSFRSGDPQFGYWEERFHEQQAPG